MYCVNTQSMQWCFNDYQTAEDSASQVLHQCPPHVTVNVLLSSLWPCASQQGYPSLGPQCDQESLQQTQQAQSHISVARVWRQGWHRGSGEQKSPSGIQGQRPSWESGALPPEVRYAYTICSGKTHFCSVFIKDIWCTFRLMRSLLPAPNCYRPPTLLLQKNSSNLYKSHDPPGQGRVGTYQPVASGYASAITSGRITHSSSSIDKSMSTAHYTL